MACWLGGGHHHHLDAHSQSESHSHAFSHPESYSQSCPPPHPQPPPHEYVDAGKKGIVGLHYAHQHDDADVPYNMSRGAGDADYDDDDQYMDRWQQHHSSDANHPPLTPPSAPVQNPSFIVIREGGLPLASPSPSPEPRLIRSDSAYGAEYGHLTGSNHSGHHVYGSGQSSSHNHVNNTMAARPATPPCNLERTQSGLSISSSASPGDSLLLLSDPSDPNSLSDLAAARLVRKHLASFRRRRSPDSQPERILRALIAPKSRGAAFPLDNDALGSIFSAANELFFASRLACRVAWDWSHPDCGQYESHIVGTTALRRCAPLGGWETLIVLSSPILRDNRYNRRLLISTFLHEMIHSYLFVLCGPKAGEAGGHNEGFRQIAAIIDEWAGREYLRMSDMEADLERFRGDDHGLDEGTGFAPAPAWHAHSIRDEYLLGPLLPPPLQHHHQHRDQNYDGDVRGEWQWNEHEDFGTYASGSTYVYQTS